MVNNFRARALELAWAWCQDDAGTCTPVHSAWILNLEEGEERRALPP